MKKSFLSRISCFATLLFLAIISPALLGSEANAQTTPATTGGKCNGTTEQDGTTACSTNTTEATCDTAGPNCYWGTVITGNANDNAFVETMCNVLKIVTGNGGKAFAAFAIISLGIGFFTGKVSWGLMIGVACGIAAMFGAPTIVAAIGGGSAFDCGS
jgi:type IV secretory pathway VirB2 component (pilin)